MWIFFILTFLISHIGIAESYNPVLHDRIIEVVSLAYHDLFEGKDLQMQQISEEIQERLSHFATKDSHITSSILTGKTLSLHKLLDAAYQIPKKKFDALTQKDIGTLGYFLQNITRYQTFRRKSISDIKRSTILTLTDILPETYLEHHYLFEAFLRLFTDYSSFSADVIVQLSFNTIEALTTNSDFMRNKYCTVMRSLLLLVQGQPVSKNMFHFKQPRNFTAHTINLPRLQKHQALCPFTALPHLSESLLFMYFTIDMDPDPTFWPIFGQKIREYISRPDDHTGSDLFLEKFAYACLTQWQIPPYSPPQEVRSLCTSFLLTNQFIRDKKTIKTLEPQGCLKTLNTTPNAYFRSLFHEMIKNPIENVCVTGALACLITRILNLNLDVIGEHQNILANLAQSFISTQPNKRIIHSFQHFLEIADHILQSQQETELLDDLNINPFYLNIRSHPFTPEDEDVINVAIHEHLGFLHSRFTELFHSGYNSSQEPKTPLIPPSKLHLFQGHKDPILSFFNHHKNTFLRFTHPQLLETTEKILMLKYCQSTVVLHPELHRNLQKIMTKFDQTSYVSIMIFIADLSTLTSFARTHNLEEALKEEPLYKNIEHFCKTSSQTFFDIPLLLISTQAQCLLQKYNAFTDLGKNRTALHTALHTTWNNSCLNPKKIAAIFASEKRACKRGHVEAGVDTSKKIKLVEPHSTIAPPLPVLTLHQATPSNASYSDISEEIQHFYQWPDFSRFISTKAPSSADNTELSQDEKKQDLDLIDRDRDVPAPLWVEAGNDKVVIDLFPSLLQ